jgi:hypothetical protein
MVVKVLEVKEDLEGNKNLYPMPGLWVMLQTWCGLAFFQRESSKPFSLMAWYGREACRESGVH